LISQITHYFGKASGINASITVDAFRISNVPTGIWKNLAQGGEEKGRSFEAVLQKVRNLKPQHVRIDHIYDFYDVVSRDSNGNLKYDFSKLDLVVNDILSLGAKPYLSLSYTPAAISSGNEIDKPADFNEWSQVVKATIEHFSGRNNRAISDVYYEVWNEPDLFGSWKTYGDKNYLTLYQASVAGANASLNVLPFKIGGPATTSLYKSWFDSFFTYATNNKLRVDFYSWHRYSKNIDDYQKDLTDVKSWLTAYPDYAKTQYVISEAGYNSDNDPGNDGVISSIHTLSLATLSGFDLGKIFHFEIKDGAGQGKYWGRWGIFTHEKFGDPQAKPRFYALQFLNKLVGNEVLDTGNGSWVRSFSSSDGRVLRTLVVNYDLQGKHFEAVPIQYNNLPTKSFMFRRINFMGGTTERFVATESATWRTVEQFDPNTAAIFEILPQ
jgi:xylan 1,4-beta-xylosidase